MEKEILTISVHQDNIIISNVLGATVIRLIVVGVVVSCLLTVNFHFKIIGGS